MVKNFEYLIELFFLDILIFIYLGKIFKVIDVLVINFYLLEFMFIMLVLVFVGYCIIMNVYVYVVIEKYCFFSYGDVMFIEKNFNVLKDVL